ncbi:MAG: nitronate monooxygenase [Bacteroidota bacterium]
MKTPVTALLDISFPIVQDPISSATTPKLVAAVANADGLGILQRPGKSRKKSAIGYAERKILLLNQVYFPKVLQIGV